MAGHPFAETIGLLRTAVETGRAAVRGRPLIFGIAGAQGSGKSTLAKAVVEALNAENLISAHISLDDFYFGRMERRRLAARIHPLFVTRGPPGTHDIDAALALVDAVAQGGEALAPSFDKAADEPRRREERSVIHAGLDVLVIEGWCLGARAQVEPALCSPINVLEKIFDSDGVWRRAVNDALGSVYQTLFSRIDHLAYLRAPHFEIVRRWRTDQEHALAAVSAPQAIGLMSPDEVSFFVQHFERITRWMMDEMPSRAATTLMLDEQRRVIDVIRPGAGR